MKKLIHCWNVHQRINVIWSFWKQTEKKAHGENDASFAVDQSEKAVFTVVPRTMRFAVAALGILCIGLTTAFASSETFRVRVFSMFAEDHGQYTAIGLREDEQKAFDVPNGWEGMYYPSYIPDEFEVVKR